MAVGNAGSLFEILEVPSISGIALASQRVFHIRYLLVILPSGTCFYDPHSNETDQCIIYLCDLPLHIHSQGLLPVYSRSIDPTADIFQQQHLGGIVGLKATTYEGGVGFNACVHAISYRTASHTTENLTYLYVFALVMAVLTFVFYPTVAKLDVPNITIPNVSNEEQIPVQHEDTSSNYTERVLKSTPWNPSDDR